MGLITRFKNKIHHGDSLSAHSSSERSDSPTELLPVPAWQGNLPCVHGATDGCNKHNPRKKIVFFDEKVPHRPKASGNAIEPDSLTEYTTPEIWSTLSKHPTTLRCLPSIHRSLPYTLSFYQINAVMTPPEGERPALTSLFCDGRTGDNPNLTWVAMPLIGTHRTLTVEFALAFTVQVKLDGWDESQQLSRAASKEWLIGSGYRDFDICRHIRLGFKSYWGKGKNGMRSAGVNYFVRIADKHESVREWRSDIDGLVAAFDPVHCTRCYTELCGRFKMIGNVVIFSVQIYKDLGMGIDTADERWMSVAGGLDIVREPEDLGRMRAEFEMFTALEMEEAERKRAEEEAGLEGRHVDEREKTEAKQVEESSNVVREPGENVVEDSGKGKDGCSL